VTIIPSLPARGTSMSAVIVNDLFRMLGALPSGMPEDDALVTISDTGVGIPAESLSRVFEMFTQADSRDRRARTGLGIGLSLARSLVEMHGGSLTAASEGKGRGSSFVVRLPLDRRRSDRAPSVAAVAPRIREPQRILIVDDNRDAADTLADLLQMIGADVRVAYDGAAALEAIGAFARAW